MFQAVLFLAFFILKIMLYTNRKRNIWSSNSLHYMHFGPWLFVSPKIQVFKSIHFFSTYGILLLYLPFFKSYFLSIYFKLHEIIEQLGQIIVQLFTSPQFQNRDNLALVS